MKSCILIILSTLLLGGCQYEAKKNFIPGQIPEGSGIFTGQKGALSLDFNKEEFIKKDS
jgi:outer membrane murein-binding lipoprotein Lpp